MKTRVYWSFAAAACAAGLAGCGHKPSEKMAGHWFSLQNGGDVEFTDKEMRSPSGVQLVDSYKDDGDKITVFMGQGAGKVGTEYTLSENGKKACTGASIDTCLVRPDRAGRLDGTWAQSADAPYPIKFGAVYLGTGLGQFRVVTYKFEGDKASVTFRDDRAMVQEPPTRVMGPSTYLFQGDDTLCPLKDPAATSIQPGASCLMRIRKPT